MVLDIWKKVLRHESINRTDNFFDVGGDSLKIIQLHKEIQSQFQRKISIADLFVYNSVDTLSEFLRQDVIVEKDIEV
jgi:acyl carrier protein